MPEPGIGLDWQVAVEEDTVNNTLYEVPIDDLRPYSYYHVRAQVTYQSGLPYVYDTGDDIIMTYETAGMYKQDFAFVVILAYFKWVIPFLPYVYLYLIWFLCWSYLRFL